MNKKFFFREMRPQRGRFGIQSSKTLKGWCPKQHELITCSNYNVGYSLNKKQRWNLNVLTLQDRYGNLIEFPIVKCNQIVKRNQAVKCTFHDQTEIHLSSEVLKNQYACYKPVNKLQILTKRSGRKYIYKSYGKQNRKKVILESKRQLQAIAFLD